MFLSLCRAGFPFCILPYQPLLHKAGIGPHAGDKEKAPGWGRRLNRGRQNSLADNNGFFLWVYYLAYNLGAGGNAVELLYQVQGLFFRQGHKEPAGGLGVGQNIA